MPSAPSAKACQTRLKSFCNDIEQSVKKLRQIEADMTTNSTTRGKQVHKRFNKETQRQQQQIIMQELYMKCKSMHEAHVNRALFRLQRTAQDVTHPLCAHSRT